MKIKRLMRRDILLRPMDVNEYTSSIIHIHKRDQHTEALNYFEVLQISEKVTMMEVGDTVLLPHLKHMPPFTFDGVRCAVTSEDEVIAVLPK